MYSAIKNVVSICQLQATIKHKVVIISMTDLQEFFTALIFV